MTGIIGGDFARKVIERLQDVAKDRGQKVAKQWGEPVNGQALSREEQMRLWNYANPQVDPIVLGQLLQAGQHNQALDYAYPYRNALIGQGDIKTRVERAQALADLAAQGGMEVMGGAA